MLCDPMDCSTSGFSALYYFPELPQTHVHWVGDAIQPSHPLSLPVPPVLNLSQHHSLFQWVSSSHQVAKALEFQLQLQSLLYIFIYSGLISFRMDWLDLLAFKGALKSLLQLEKGMANPFSIPACTNLSPNDGCESWTIKKAEGQRTDASELWCWRRLLRVPWTARRSNQSILKEISPGISLEGMILKLKLQYFGHLMRRVDSLEKTVMLGKIEGGRRRGRQRLRWLDGITNLMDMSLSRLQSWWWTGRPGVL